MLVVVQLVDSIMLWLDLILAWLRISTFLSIAFSLSSMGLLAIQVA